MGGKARGLGVAMPSGGVMYGLLDPDRRPITGDPWQRQRIKARGTSRRRGDGTYEYLDRYGLVYAADPPRLTLSPSPRCNWFDEVQDELPEAEDVPASPTLPGSLEDESCFLLEGDEGEPCRVQTELQAEEVETRAQGPDIVFEHVDLPVQVQAEASQTVAEDLPRFLEDRWTGSVQSDMGCDLQQFGRDLGAGLARAGRLLRGIFLW